MPPKLYYPTPDEVQGCRPLNENKWFKRYQPLLLALANTDAGRDLLCLDPRRKRPERIIGLKKNVAVYWLGQGGSPPSPLMVSLSNHHYLSDFRVGAKWGNVIRSRWQEVQVALARMNELALAKQPRRFWLPDGRWLPVPAGAVTDTFFPDPDPESTTIDGELTRATTTSWEDARTGAGVGVNSALATVIVYGEKDGATWTVGRLAFLFDTGPTIPDGNTIDSGTFSVFRDTADPSNNSETVNPANQALVSSNPATNTNLVVGDYAIANWGSTRFGTDITTTNMISPTGYKDWALNASGLTNISKTGVSKFGLRGAGDMDSLAPTLRSFIYLKAADTAGTGNDPKLVVVHSVPAATFTPRMVVF